MQDSFFDFLCATLIPVLRSDVSAGSAGYIHRCLVFVAAVRTLPYELVVAVGHNLYFTSVTAFLAAVRFCVELSVHDVLVDVFEKRHYGRNIIFHVRNFNIAYSSSR